MEESSRLIINMNSKIPNFHPKVICVILSPRHSPESQGSAFQSKLSLYVIAIDHGLIANSEEKLENETVFL
jgi:hypothetical protein